MIDKIDLPGPYRDNISRLLMAERFLNDEVTYNPPSNLNLFGKIFYLNSFYNGVSALYLFVIPTLIIFGFSPETIGIHGIMVVVLTTVFTFLFAKEAFNTKTGLVSAAMLSFMVSTVFFGKFPIWTSLTVVFWFIASLYFLIKWKKSTKKLYMILAFVSLGIGTSEKILFVWPLVALIITYFIFRPKIDNKIKHLPLIIISFLSGGIVLVVSLILRFQNTIDTIVTRSTTTPYGHENIMVFDHLVDRLSQFRQLLDGGFFTMFGDSHTNDVFFIFFLISIMGIFIMRIKNPNPYFKRSLFLIIILSIMLFLSIFTVTILNTAQLVILLPIPAIIISIFIVSFSENIHKFTNKKISSFPIILGLTLFLIVGNFLVIDQYKKDLEKTGGIGTYSSVIIEVTHFLQTNNYTSVLTLDWGSRAPILLVSEKELIPGGAILYDHGDFQVNKYKNTIKESLNDPTRVYLKNVKDIPVDGSNLYFKEVLEEQNKKLVLIKTFKEWDGKDLYYLYKAE